MPKGYILAAHRSPANPQKRSEYIDLEKEDEFIEMFLGDEKTKVVINQRDVCVCIL